jgi:hypothetical protein
MFFINCNGQVEVYETAGSCPDCDLNDLLCHSPFRGKCKLDSGRIYKVVKDVADKEAMKKKGVKV